MNPVTLKELRQLTRSRTITGAISGLFLIQLLVASLVVAADTNDHGLPANAGEHVFGWLSSCLSAAMVLVIPGNVFARLVSERGTGRTDLLSATALRPSALVDGKILSGLALIALVLAGSLPFLLLAHLLGGVDVLLVLAWAFAVAACASVSLHLSVLIGTLRLPSSARWAVWGLLAAVSLPFVLAGSLYFIEELDWTDLGWLLSVFACLCAANALLRGFAIERMAPTGTDRSRPLRLTALGLWCAAWAVVAVLSFANLRGGWAGAFARLLDNVCLSSAFLGSPILFFATFEASAPSGPGRRVLAERPRARWRRVLRWPLTTGAESGLAFALLLLLADGLAAAAAASLRFQGPWAAPIPPDEAARLAGNFRAGNTQVSIILAYAFAALLLARALLRLPALERRSAFRWTGLAAVAFLALAALVPNLLAAGGSFDPAFSPFNLAGVEPPRWSGGSASAWRLDSPGSLDFHLPWAFGALFAGLLFHARAFARSFRTYLRR